MNNDDNNVVESEDNSDIKVKEMQRIHNNGKANRLCNLKVGDCISETVKLSLDDSKVDDITATLGRLRSGMTRTVADARERSGYTFNTQSTVSLTSSFDIVISLVVTRES